MSTQTPAHVRALAKDAHPERFETPAGLMPMDGALDLDGLEGVGGEQIRRLLSVNIPDWKAEVRSIRTFYDRLGEGLPDELRDELGALEQRLNDAGDQPSA